MVYLDTKFYIFGTQTTQKCQQNKNFALKLTKKSMCARPKNDQNSQKKNDSKPEENVEISSTVKESPAIFIDYKSHPKFNEELQNFENTLQAQCSKFINPIWKN